MDFTVNRIENIAIDYNNSAKQFYLHEQDGTVVGTRYETQEAAEDAARRFLKSQKAAQKIFPIEAYRAEPDGVWPAKITSYDEESRDIRVTTKGTSFKTGMRWSTYLRKTLASEYLAEAVEELGKQILALTQERAALVSAFIKQNPDLRITEENILKGTK